VSDAGAVGATDTAGAISATGSSGPSVRWTSPVDLIHPSLAAQFPGVELSSVDVTVSGGRSYKQYVAKIPKNDSN